MLRMEGLSEFVRVVGHRLRVARVDAGKTMAEAAHDMHVSAPTLSCIERGNTVSGPTVGQLWTLCRIYGCPIDHIINGGNKHGGT